MNLNYSLYVRDPWLYYIQIGIKKVEGRKGNPEKFKHWIGKKVYFFNNERKIPVYVEEIRHYPDLSSYLDNEGFENVLPGIKSKEHATQIYNEFYDDDVIKKAGGMLAIVVSLTK